VLGIGSIVGMAVTGLQVSQVVSVAVALLFALVIVLFVFALVTAVRLWQGTAFGRKWAPILFASQIPVLSLPGLRYEWYTGAPFKFIIAPGPGLFAKFYFTFPNRVGAGFAFNIGAGITQYIIGVNLVAVLALVLLLRAYRAFRLREAQEVF